MVLRRAGSPGSGDEGHTYWLWKRLLPPPVVVKHQTRVIPTLTITKDELDDLRPGLGSLRSILLGSLVGASVGLFIALLTVDLEGPPLLAVVALLTASVIGALSTLVWILSTARRAESAISRIVESSTTENE